MTAILLHLNTYADIAPPRIRDLIHRDKADLVRDALRDGLYIAVARTDTNDLDLIYEGSQNGIRTQSWSKHPVDGIEPLGQGSIPGPNGGALGYRSSMVGDVIVLDGRAHVVSSLGFTDLEYEVDLGTIPVIGGGSIADAARVAP